MNRHAVGRDDEAYKYAGSIPVSGTICSDNQSGFHS